MLRPEQYEPTGHVNLDHEHKLRCAGVALELATLKSDQSAAVVPAVAAPTVTAVLTPIIPSIHTLTDDPLNDPNDIAVYIRTYTGANAPPLASWHYCNCTVVTKVKPKKSNKVMRKEAEIRAAKIEFVRKEAAKMGIPEDNPELVATCEQLSIVPPRKEKPTTLDAPCDYKVKNRNAMRVHLRTIHSVYYCEYCRTRWNKPQKQKWKEHGMKYPSGQCRFLANGGFGPGKGAVTDAASTSADVTTAE